VYVPRTREVLLDCWVLEEHRVTKARSRLRDEFSHLARTKGLARTLTFEPALLGLRAFEACNTLNYHTSELQTRLETVLVSILLCPRTGISFGTIVRHAVSGAVYPLLLSLVVWRAVHCFTPAARASRAAAGVPGSAYSRTRASGVTMTAKPFVPPETLRGLFVGSGSDGLNEVCTDLPSNRNTLHCASLLPILHRSIFTLWVVFCVLLLLSHVHLVSACVRKQPLVCQTILELAGKPPTQVNVLYIGTATYDLPGPRQRQTGRFVQAGCSVTSIDVVDNAPSAAELASTVAAADVIVVSGGNLLSVICDRGPHPSSAPMRSTSQHLVLSILTMQRRLSLATDP
jgi:hypothetical protein